MDSNGYMYEAYMGSVMVSSYNPVIIGLDILIYALRQQIELTVVPG